MSTRKKLATSDQTSTPPAVELDLPLHLKYRPQSFKEVIGQDAVVKSLRENLAAKTLPHVYLFTGGPGTGKTTLARIMAREVNVDPANLVEVDAASSGGIDVMREVMAPLRYQGFGKNPNKAVILDEAHMLSKQAWASLLKTVEEPPAHVFFFFCTTESGKVPENIRTRCMAYNLRSVGFDDLMDLLDLVDAEEELNTSAEVRTLVAREAGGSPRQALVMLAMVRGLMDKEAAARILETVTDGAEIIELCRELISGRLTWAGAVKIIKGLGDLPAESARIVIMNYLAAVAMGAKSERDAVRALDYMEAFKTPYLASDKMAPLLMSIGRILFD